MSTDWRSILLLKKRMISFQRAGRDFQELLIRFPPHGYEKWRLIQFFYQGLTQSTRSIIESMNGGASLSLTGDEAYKTLDKLSNNSQQWDFSSCWDKFAHIPKKGGIYEVREDTNLNRKLDALTRKLDALTLGQYINATNTFNGDSCSFCASPMHLALNFPSSPTSVKCSTEQVNAFNDYRKQANGPFSESYNPRWQNHPNFSWK
jgi:hypothetical protein